MPSSPPTLRKRSYTFYPYVYLLIAADTALQSAKTAHEGRNYHYATGVTFSAFAVEAALNHIGTDRIPGWVNKERNLDYDQRLKKIVRYCKLAPDFTTRPFLTVKELVAVRNNLTHGKTWEGKQFYVDGDGGDESDGFPDWLRSCLNERRATEVVNDARKVAEELLEAAKYPKIDFYAMGGRRDVPVGQKDSGAIAGPMTWSIKSPPPPPPPVLHCLACKLKVVGVKVSERSEATTELVNDLEKGWGLDSSSKKWRILPVNSDYVECGCGRFAVADLGAKVASGAVVERLSLA